MGLTDEFMRQDKPSGTMSYIIFRIRPGEERKMKKYLWNLHYKIVGFQRKYKTAFKNAHNN